MDAETELTLEALGSEAFARLKDGTPDRETTDMLIDQIGRAAAAEAGPDGYPDIAAPKAAGLRLAMLSHQELRHAELGDLLRAVWSRRVTPEMPLEDRREEWRPLAAARPPCPEFAECRNSLHYCESEPLGHATG